MAYDRFMIAPVNSGLQTDLKPWLIQDDAWAQLNNAYVFRGRVRKRFGSELMGTGWSSVATAPLYSRLRIMVGTTDGAGDLSATVPGAIFKVGQMFSIGDNMFTVYNSAAGAQPMLKTGGTATTYTYNIGTGAYVFVGAAVTTAVYFYPADPVMGITNYETGTINNHPSYAFDTQFAYLFSGGSWNRSDTAGVPVWRGTDLHFFWTTNWQAIVNTPPVLFVTNFNAAIGAPVPATDDPIYTFGNPSSTWAAFSALTIFKTAGDFVQTAKIIVPFKNRLILLNTIENIAGVHVAFTNRCRFSHNGSPFATNAWLEPNQTTGGQNADGAGYIDASTEEQIVSAEFTKDRLIVYFERSTWELAYTGNEIQPFVWQKINTELGSESTFSTISFDKQILTIGNTGVHACNGSNVERIDNLIPDQIFTIRDKDNGPARIWGIRDYFTEMVYWTFPSTNQVPSEKFPTRVLVYNYKNGTWAFNDDCITAFGYFEQQTGATWAIQTETWAVANFAWRSGTISAQFRQVIAGNQQGFVFIIDDEESRNAPVMQITNMDNTTPYLILLIIDHTLNVGDYIYIENAQGVTFSTTYTIYPVYQVIDPDHVSAGPATFTGTYTGGGTAARVSNLGILSKQWNPYVDKGRDVYLAKIDFGVLRTTAGQVTVDYFPSASEMSMIDEGINTGAILGTNVLETFPYPTVLFEAVQDRLWHPVYFQTEGQCIQILIHMSAAQLANPAIALADFELEGLMLHVMATSSRLQ